MKMIINKCYLWSILANLFPVDKDSQRVSKYKKYENMFDKALEGIEFPMKVQSNNKFVNRVNNLNLIEGGLSINIYHHNNNYKIQPLSDITKDEKKNHIDLLF
jgi:glutamine cyclotransferase